MGSSEDVQYVEGRSSSSFHTTSGSAAKVATARARHAGRLAIHSFPKSPDQGEAVCVDIVVIYFWNSAKCPPDVVEAYLRPFDYREVVTLPDFEPQNPEPERNVSTTLLECLPLTPF